MIDRLLEAPDIELDELEGTLGTGSNAGTAGDAFVGDYEAMGPPHDMSRTESHAGLASDASVLVDDDDPRWKPPQRLDRTHVDAQTALVAVRHLVTAPRLDDLQRCPFSPLVVPVHDLGTGSFAVPVPFALFRMED